MAAPLKRKSYKFVSPEGKIMTFKTLQEFCDISNILPSNACHLIQGHRTHRKGWRATSAKAIKKQHQRDRVLINLLTTERVVFQSAAQFARKYAVSEPELYELLNGKHIVWKNWVLEETYKLLPELSLSLSLQ